MGQLERYYFSLSLSPRSPSQERENKLKLICIKCLSRQTCPLRGDRAKIPHPARSKQGGRGKAGGGGVVCAYPRECVLSQLTRNEPLNFLALSMHYAHISLLLVKTKNKVSMHQDRRVRADEEGGLQ